MDKNDLKNYFPEFKKFQCKFSDCNHQENILGCMVHQAALDGDILYSRYENYIKGYGLENYFIKRHKCQIKTRMNQTKKVLIIFTK